MLTNRLFAYIQVKLPYFSRSLFLRLKLKMQTNFFSSQSFMMDVFFYSDTIWVKFFSAITFELWPGHLIFSDRRSVSLYLFDVTDDSSADLIHTLNTL